MKRLLTFTCIVLLFLTLGSLVRSGCVTTGHMQPRETDSGMHSSMRPDPTEAGFMLVHLLY